MTMHRIDDILYVSTHSKRGKSSVLFNIQVRTAPLTRSVLVIESNNVKQCRVNVAVCSEAHTEHTNALCGHNLEILVVHEVTTGFERLVSTLIHMTYQSTALPVLLPGKE
jgi:hypothetical protein